MEQNITHIPEDNSILTKEIEQFKADKYTASSRGSACRYSRKTKESNQRPPIVFGSGSRFNLPDTVIQKLKNSDKVLGFIVYSNGGIEVKENYWNAIERGWKPLDSREFPELSRQYELSPFGKTEEDYFIRRGGQIAMMRDKEDDDAEREYYDSERRRQEYMTAMYRQTDPRSPKPFLDERSKGKEYFISRSN